MSGSQNPYSGKETETIDWGEGVCAYLSSTLNRPLKDTVRASASEVDRPSIFYRVVLVGPPAFDAVSYRPRSVVVRRLEVEEGGRGGGGSYMVWRWLLLRPASRSTPDLCYTWVVL